MVLKYTMIVNIDKKDFCVFIPGFKHWDRKEDLEKLEKVRERYTNSKYGYQIVMSYQKINYIEK